MVFGEVAFKSLEKSFHKVFTIRIYTFDDICYNNSWLNVKQTIKYILRESEPTDIQL